MNENYIQWMVDIKNGNYFDVDEKFMIRIINLINDVSINESIINTKLIEEAKDIMKHINIDWNI